MLSNLIELFCRDDVSFRMIYITTLTYLFQIGQTLALPLHDGGHATESRPFQLFASVQRVSILEETNIVLGHIVDL